MNIYFDIIILFYIQIGPCKSNEFMCGNGQCIENTDVCDGVNHCPDLSDEADCKFLD